MWIFAIIIFAAYWSLVEILKAKGVLEKRNITAIGPILMIRTKKGLNFLEKVAKPRKFWRTLATVGIPSIFVGMFFMLILVLLMDYKLITSPPKPSPLTSPRNVLLIPGINQYIPLVWGLIGLIVTLVVHEFSHGILCRVEGVRVKSLGILLALLPIGGFAEPDEEELSKKANKMQRIRIFSAGVISNFITAIIAFSIFFYLLGFISPLVVVRDVDKNSVAYGLIHEGDIILSINNINVKTPDDVSRALKNCKEIRIVYKHKDEIKEITLPKIVGINVTGLYRMNGKMFPAEKAGIKKGMIIFKVNDRPTATLKDFMNVMRKTKPNETVKIYVYYNGEIKVFNVTLEKSPNNNHGFLGIFVEEYISGISLVYSDTFLKELKSLPSKLTSIEGWLLMMFMPFTFPGFSESITKYFEGEAITFYLLNTFYWIAWLNFYVGLFNCLPAVPLDGGRVLQESLSALLSRKFGEKGEEIASTAIRFLAVLVFASIFLAILIPNLHSLIP